MKCIKRLNPRQREAVNELDFGAILHYNVPYLPNLLGYWILSVFNPNRCRIEFSSEESLPIFEEDVHLTFGFPKGATLIERPAKAQTNFTFLDDVAGRLDKDRYMCTTS